MVCLVRLNVPDFEKVQDEGKAGITSGQREPSLKNWQLIIRMQLPKKMEIGPGVTL